MATWKLVFTAESGSNLWVKVPWGNRARKPGSGQHGGRVRAAYAAREGRSGRPEDPGSGEESHKLLDYCALSPCQTEAGNTLLTSGQQTRKFTKKHSPGWVTFSSCSVTSSKAKKSTTCVLFIAFVDHVLTLHKGQFIILLVLPWTQEETSVPRHGLKYLPVTTPRILLSLASHPLALSSPLSPPHSAPLTVLGKRSLGKTEKEPLPRNTSIFLEGTLEGYPILPSRENAQAKLAPAAETRPTLASSDPEFPTCEFWLFPCLQLPEPVQLSIR